MPPLAYGGPLEERGFSFEVPVDDGPDAHEGHYQEEKAIAEIVEKIEELFYVTLPPV